MESICDPSPGLDVLCDVQRSKQEHKLQLWRRNMDRTKIGEYGLQMKKEARGLLLTMGIRFCSQGRNRLFYEWIDGETSENGGSFFSYQGHVRYTCELPTHKSWLE